MTHEFEDCIYLNRLYVLERYRDIEYNYFVMGKQEQL